MSQADPITFSLSEAKARLSELLTLAEAGADVRIARLRRPMEWRLVPIPQQPQPEESQE